MNRPGFFVTGTGTGVGKTHVTAALVAALRARGEKAWPMKPVQTGSDNDLDFVLTACGLEAGPTLRAALAPVRLPLAASPHLAARTAGVTLSVAALAAAVEARIAAGDIPVVEGAGGLLAPLNDTETQLDLIRACGLPVVLAAAPGLGTLNHTLLAARELERAGCPPALVVLSGFNGGNIEDDNLATLRARLTCPVEPLPRTTPFTPAAGATLLEKVPTVGKSTTISNDWKSSSHRGAESAEGKDFSPQSPIENRKSKISSPPLWHPYTKASAVAAGLPMIVRGEGIHLWDAEGRRYVDAIASWWCVMPGHRHPHIEAAIRAQAGELHHSILGNLAHPQAARLASRLAALMPTPDRHVLFASDGASAVEQALKIAVQYHAITGAPRRTRFACLRDAYHGDTLGAMAVGYQEAWHRAFKPLLAEAVFVEPGGSLAPLEAHAEELAAVIVEPLCLGAAGMRVYSAAWLAELAAWCRAHGVLLIADEIAMGFGRTGRMFAFEHAGIDPDLVCVGKALSGGALPISATIAKDTLYAAFSDKPTDHTLQHGHTFCGNPLAAAASNAALDVYEAWDIAGRCAALGARLEARLRPLAVHPRVKEVRSLGLLCAVELHPEAAPANVPLPHRIRLRLQEQGILLRPLGPVLYLMPPAAITETELDALADTFAEAIRATP